MAVIVGDQLYLQGGIALSNGLHSQVYGFLNKISYAINNPSLAMQSVLSVVVISTTCLQLIRSLSEVTTLRVLYTLTCAYMCGPDCNYRGCLWQVSWCVPCEINGSLCPLLSLFCLTGA